METELHEKEDEWLWDFLTLGSQLTNCIYDGKSSKESFKGKTRKQIMKDYKKKAEGINMKSAIDRYVKGLEEKYKMDFDDNK